MDIRPLALDGAFEIIPRRFEDNRGFFTESWSSGGFAAHGLHLDFVQDNHSLSRERGTVRGLHYQSPPMAQDKLVRVTHGRAFDVLVDLRPESPTYRRWASLILDARLGNQALVPKGFAHGLQTLDPDCEVQYKVTAPYAPDCDRSIRWDDPEIGVDWPLPVLPELLSPKDRDAPLLRDQAPGF